MEWSLIAGTTAPYAFLGAGWPRRLHTHGMARTMSLQRQFGNRQFVCKRRSDAARFVGTDTATLGNWRARRDQRLHGGQGGTRLQSGRASRRPDSWRTGRHRPRIARAAEGAAEDRIAATWYGRTLPHGDAGRVPGSGPLCGDGTGSGEHRRRGLDAGSGRYGQAQGGQLRRRQ